VAKEAEEKRLRAFMQDELAELIMLRLESQLRRAAAAASSIAGAITAVVESGAAQSRGDVQRTADVAEST